MRSVWLATEDEASEAVGLRLLADHGDRLTVNQPLRRNGSGYLRSRLDSFCQMAMRGQILVLLTDLDRVACPVALRHSWFGQRSVPDGLLFRVVIRSIEAWIMADSSGLAAFLQVNEARLPSSPETLTEPKLELLALASRAPRDIRRDMVEQRQGRNCQASGYNARLVEFISSGWSPERAAANAPSLARARMRIAEIAST